MRVSVLLKSIQRVVLVSSSPLWSVKKWPCHHISGAIVGASLSESFAWSDIWAPLRCLYRNILQNSQAPAYQTLVLWCAEANKGNSPYEHFRLVTLKLKFHLVFVVPRRLTLTMTLRSSHYFPKILKASLELWLGLWHIKRYFKKLSVKMFLAVIQLDDFHYHRWNASYRKTWQSQNVHYQWWLSIHVMAMRFDTNADPHLIKINSKSCWYAFPYYSLTNLMIVGKCFTNWAMVLTSTWFLQYLFISTRWYSTNSLMMMII